MPDTNSVALGGGAPSLIQLEPLSSEPPDAQATACIDPSSGGVSGAGGAGAEELVRRFGGSEGAGPNLDPPETPTDGSCGDDALRAMASCAAAVRDGMSRGPWGAVIAAVSCAGALGGYVECVATAENAPKPSGVR